MPQGMAGGQVQGEQHNVYQQNQCANADAKMQLLIGPREPEGSDGVIPEEAQEDDGAIKKIAMEILQDERKTGFAAIVSMRRLAHGAARRVQEERAIVSFAIVIAGHAEAERESQNEECRRIMPPVVRSVDQR